MNRKLVYTDYSKVLHWDRYHKNKFIHTRTWRKFSKNMKEQRGYLCDNCKNKFDTLHCHHLEPENYSDLNPDKFLILCNSCHTTIENTGRVYQDEALDNMIKQYKENFNKGREERFEKAKEKAKKVFELTDLGFSRKYIEEKTGIPLPSIKQYRKRGREYYGL